jgi:hypothetical protein
MSVRAAAFRVRIFEAPGMARQMETFPDVDGPAGTRSSAAEIGRLESSLFANLDARA